MVRRGALLGVPFTRDGHLTQALARAAAEAELFAEQYAEEGLIALFGILDKRVVTDRLDQNFLVVPVSTAALAIMEDLTRFKGRPWLAPNPDTLKLFVSIKHGWQQAIRTAKLLGLRIHDLRRSAASFMVNSGVDLFAVGKAPVARRGLSRSASWRGRF